MWGGPRGSRINSYPGVMSRPGHELPVPPRLPRALSSDPALRLTPGTDLKGFTVEGDFSESEIEDLLVEDCHVLRSSFTAAGLRGLRLIDVLVEGSDFSGADGEEASFTRVQFTGCRLSGALLSHARMQDVTFSDVKLDGVNFRMCAGERVLFDRVNLERADFYSAQLKHARFFDCDLRGADVSQAAVPGARFHGSILSEFERKRVSSRRRHRRLAGSSIGDRGLCGPEHSR